MGKKGNSKNRKVIEQFQRRGVSNKGKDKALMKVVLIALYDTNSFAIRILHKMLSQAGYDVTSVFFQKMQMNEYDTNVQIGLLLNFLKKREPDIIGISFRSSFFQLATLITKMIKENLNTVVLWGGTHPTISPEECIKIADMVCVGEGEEAIMEVVDCLRKGDQPYNVKNIWIREGKKIIRNPVRAPIDVNKVVPPDWSNKNKYFIENNRLFTDFNSELNIYKDGFYPIMASRGCPYSCTYCCNNVYKRIYPKDYIRKRTVKSVIEELVLAKKTYPHLKKVVFSDDMMVTSEDWVKEFCSEYKRKISLPFNCQFIPTYVNESIISVLKDAGMSTVTMGIQSGSERVRKEVYKRGGYTNNIVIRNARLFKKYKLTVNYDVILDNPFETADETMMTLDLLCKLPTPFKLRMYSLIYFPQTELTNAALDGGIINPGDVEHVKKKALREWRVVLDSKTKDKNAVFLNNLIALTAISFVPRFLIRFLSRRTILKKNPKLITYIGFLFGASERIKKGFYYIFVKGDLKIIMKYLRNKLMTSVF